MILLRKKAVHNEGTKKAKTRLVSHNITKCFLDVNNFLVVSMKRVIKGWFFSTNIIDYIQCQHS